MTDKSYYVYAHYHPYSSAPFYIGKGKGPRAWNKTQRNDEWFPQAAKGLEVSIVMSGLSEACAYTMEKILISSLYPDMIVNRTKGGGGPSGMKQSPKSNAKRSAALKGEKNHNYGRKLPEYIRQALIRRHTGSKHSDEHRRKRSLSQSGRGHAQFDWTEYEFFHEIHGHVKCLRSELIEKYHLSAPKVSNIINGRRPHHKGWRMASPTEERAVRNYKR